MKKFFAVLLSATVLAAPLAAQAQDRHSGPDRHRAVQRNVVIQKKVVVVKPRWSKGHRMTAGERRRMAEIRDYRRYRLSAPPRGYHWVKVDNDFLLVGVASGVISSFIAAR
ncbi:Ni/Co efflux regulator RcnB [Neorhizobium galegae]|uniref:RcnB family protein n=1 Tax=Neorhizobium galegae TaxID=399 RepID=UPI001AE26EBE|nr:RcnB family protein [Neorhizobium galegae]MBP2558870.1 Ni/Co efflux regulator RcnB [Neorhizobium galegae]